MGCCGQASWKREEVPDHKFDFIDVRDYYTDGWLTKLRYVILFLLVIKSIAVYIADIYTAITLLALGHFAGNIYNSVENSPDNTVKVPIVYGKWVFTGCIIFSFLLLAYEAHRARAVIRSRDISYAYTNVMANNYYSLKSYDHFCFFCQINNSKKKKDEFAFFIFFTFKGWKRLLVADGPRQVINALTLFALGQRTHWSTDVWDYYEGNIFTGIMLLTMIFTVVVFAGSAILLAIAAIMYLPLVCYIQGNLKEYCCHKIDKRIAELVQKKKKQRLAKHAAIARAEAEGDFSHLMNKKGEIVGKKMVQPTLPQVDIDLLEDAKPRVPGAAPPGHKRLHSFGSEKGGAMYAQSETGSTAHLVANAGYAGSAGGYHNSPGDSYTSPSMPPTAHNSPDSYPNHVRGINGAPQSIQRAMTASDDAALMAQLGPIGTSPALFAQHVKGRPSAASNSAAAAAPGYDDGGQQQLHGRSRLAQAYTAEPQAWAEQQEHNAAYYGSQGGYNDGYGAGDYGDGQYGASSGSHYGHAVEPAPADLSAWAPYDDEGIPAYSAGQHQQQTTADGGLRADNASASFRDGASSLHRPASYNFGDVYDEYLDHADEQSYQGGGGQYGGGGVGSTLDSGYGDAGAYRGDDGRYAGGYEGTYSDRADYRYDDQRQGYGHSHVAAPTAASDGFGGVSTLRDHRF